MLPALLFSRLPVAGVKHPIFIIGCGRSGTTILGEALSKHRCIAYLNEPRALWISAYPNADVWTDRAALRQGKLVFHAQDAASKRSTRLTRLFRFATIKARKPVLVEKLPINSFRLAFLLQVFPDARFIHLVRNGLEVAMSIEQQALAGEWFGAASYKWKQLVAYAARQDDTRHLLTRGWTPFEQGLLEWRLSTGAALRFFERIQPHRYTQLSYDALVSAPDLTMFQLLHFLGLPEDETVLHFARQRIARASGKLTATQLNHEWEKIGGPLLLESMHQPFVF